MVCGGLKVYQHDPAKLREIYKGMLDSQNKEVRALSEQGWESIRDKFPNIIDVDKIKNIKQFLQFLSMEFQTICEDKKPVEEAEICEQTSFITDDKYVQCLVEEDAFFEKIFR